MFRTELGAGNVSLSSSRNMTKSQLCDLNMQSAIFNLQSAIRFPIYNERYGLL